MSQPQPSVSASRLALDLIERCAKIADPWPGLGTPAMNCPKCNAPCDRDSVDVGVGIIHGPYGCANCGWSEDEAYDLSDGKNPVDEKGGSIDQWGGYHPPGSSMALAYRLAQRSPEGTET